MNYHTIIFIFARTFEIKWLKLVASYSVLQRRILLLHYVITFILYFVCSSFPGTSEVLLAVLHKYCANIRLTQ